MFTARLYDLFQYALGAAMTFAGLWMWQGPWAAMAGLGFLTSLGALWRTNQP